MEVQEVQEVLHIVNTVTLKRIKEHHLQLPCWVFPELLGSLKDLALIIHLRPQIHTFRVICFRSRGLLTFSLALLGIPLLGIPLLGIPLLGSARR